jgi:threonyl-tRNA synthetase
MYIDNEEKVCNFLVLKRHFAFHSYQKTLNPEDLTKLELISGAIVKERQPFERLEMRKEDLLRMFEYNEFKKRIINEKVQTPTTTVYRCGPLIGIKRIKLTIIFTTL